MAAYYNEIDAFPVQWLRNLREAKHIAFGHIDSRSILEVTPDDVRDYTQAHFFAGIGVWSHALRLAGFPDDQPVWTGSCPCQPFSVAGRGKGIEDERHLWPVWRELIRECHPPIIFGEQVASAAGRDWLASVRSDLEEMGYAVGATDLCAAGVGAPHIRQRIYFGAVAHSYVERCKVQRLLLRQEGRGQGAPEVLEAPGSGQIDGGEPYVGIERMAHTPDVGLDGGRTSQAGNGGDPTRLESERLRDVGGVGNAQCEHPGRDDGSTPRAQEACQGEWERVGPISHFPEPSSPWSYANWVYCRDGKYRPVEPSVFPLSHGSPQRLGRLRATGNAICAPQAAAFIVSFIQAVGDLTNA